MNICRRWVYVGLRQNCAKVHLHPWHLQTMTSYAVCKQNSVCIRSILRHAGRAVVHKSSEPPPYDIPTATYLRWLHRRRRPRATCSCSAFCYVGTTRKRSKAGSVKSHVHGSDRSRSHGGGRAYVDKSEWSSRDSDSVKQR